MISKVRTLNIPPLAARLIGHMEPVTDRLKTPQPGEPAFGRSARSANQGSRAYRMSSGAEISSIWGPAARRVICLPPATERVKTRHSQNGFSSTRRGLQPGTSEPFA